MNTAKPSPSADWAAGPGMYHGGMLARARALFPDAPLPFLDLSTGINPVAYPLPPFAPEVLQRLPEADDVARLESMAAAAFGLSDPGCVLAGPGTQIFISLLPRLMRRRDAKVAVLSPTYGEHAPGWASAGCEVSAEQNFDALAEAEIAVLCRPNNPDGRIVPRGDVLALADSVAARGGFLVVDEAFADLEGEGLSLAPEIGKRGLIVLRSFGKWSGLAGLRLGFLLGPPGLIAEFRTALGPWAVSGPALAAGLAAYPDSGWRANSASRLDQDVARLDGVLADFGMSLRGGTRLFRLYEGSSAQKLWRQFGEAGILTRRFEFAPDWLRVGMPGDEGDWMRMALVSRTI